MSREQITCEDCGYVYRGCTAVDQCPRCDEESDTLAYVAEVLSENLDLHAEVKKLKRYAKRLEDERATLIFNTEPRKLKS